MHRIHNGCCNGISNKRSNEDERRDCRAEIIVGSNLSHVSTTWAVYPVCEDHTYGTRAYTWLAASNTTSTIYSYAINTITGSYQCKGDARCGETVLVYAWFVPPLLRRRDWCIGGQLEWVGNLIILSLAANRL